MSFLDWVYSRESGAYQRTHGREGDQVEATPAGAGGSSRTSVASASKTMVSASCLFSVLCKLAKKMFTVYKKSVTKLKWAVIKLHFSDRMDSSPRQEGEEDGKVKKIF